MSTTKLTPQLMDKYLYRDSNVIPKSTKIPKEYYKYIQLHEFQLTKIILLAII